LQITNILPVTKVEEVHSFAWMFIAMMPIDLGLFFSLRGKPVMDLVCIHQFFSTTVLYHPERRHSTLAASLSASGRSSEKMLLGENLSIENR
jgi:hypothetical protein